MIRLCHKGFSLVELIVALGLFASIMTIATTAYLVMINANRNAQSISAGTNNLTYALENMARNIRIGTRYSCDTPQQFSFRDISGISTTYRRDASTNGYKIVRVVDGAPSDLTDTLVDITNLTFTCLGTAPSAGGTGGDAVQAHVTIVVSGSISAGQGRPPKVFNIETSATMRANDLI